MHVERWNLREREREQALVVFCFAFMFSKAGEENNKWNVITIGEGACEENFIFLLLRVCGANSAFVQGGKKFMNRFVSRELLKALTLVRSLLALNLNMKLRWGKTLSLLLLLFNLRNLLMHYLICSYFYCLFSVLLFLMTFYARDDFKDSEEKKKEKKRWRGE